MAVFKQLPFDLSFDVRFAVPLAATLWFGSVT